MLYRATDGGNWSDDTNWLTDAPLGDWYGVEVDENGRVTALRLGGWDNTAQELPRLRRLEIGGTGS